MDPIYIALGTAITGLAGVLYRALLKRAERAEAAEQFWRDRALLADGLAEIATDVAEKRSSRK